jgi:hypothetical protein
MTSADRPSAELPYVVASVTCDGCSSGFVTTRRPGEPIPPTALAGEWAGRSGWNRGTRYATGWRCPRCRQRYGDTGSPRRFTVREVIARHRSRTGPPR